MVKVSISYIMPRLQKEAKLLKHPNARTLMQKLRAEGEITLLTGQKFYVKGEGEDGTSFTFYKEG